MNTLSKSLLLFFLNWLDAQLTIIWVRTGAATEGNGLMARLLEMGDPVFLGVKVLVGAFAAYVLYRCSHFTLARRGLKLTLGVYGALMFVHLATGMHAIGWHAPETLVVYLGNLPNILLSLFV